MTFAIGVLIDTYFYDSSIKKSNKEAHFMIPTVLFDVAIIVTGFVLGGLILSGAIDLSHTIAYAGIGVGGAVFAADMILMQLMNKSLKQQMASIGYPHSHIKWLI